MGTIVTEQAGKEYTIVQSNNGIRVLFKGVEVYRHWPESNTAPVAFDAAPINIVMEPSQ